MSFLLEKIYLFARLKIKASVQYRQADEIGVSEARGLYDILSFALWLRFDNMRGPSLFFALFANIVERYDFPRKCLSEYCSAVGKSFNGILHYKSGSFPGLTICGKTFTPRKPTLCYRL